MRKKTGADKTAFGADLIEGMKLVLAHRRGKIELDQIWPKPIDIKAEFSRAYAAPSPAGLSELNIDNSHVWQTAD